MRGRQDRRILHFRHVRERVDRERRIASVIGINMEHQSIPRRERGQPRCTYDDTGRLSSPSSPYFRATPLHLSSTELQFKPMHLYIRLSNADPC